MQVATFALTLNAPRVDDQDAEHQQNVDARGTNSCYVMPKPLLLPIFAGSVGSDSSGALSINKIPLLSSVPKGALLNEPILKNTY